MTDTSKLRPSHLRKVVRARRRWARRALEDRIGFSLQRWPPHGSATAELGRLLHRLDVQCVIDVGAHHGEFGQRCRRLGFDGDLVSFEPSTDAFRRLVRTIQRRGDDRWLAHQLALGSSEGIAELGIFAQSQLNSLRAPQVGRDAYVSDRPTATEEVRVVRLDGIWDQLPPTRSNTFLKVDAQGHDLEVIRGAEQSLRHCVAVQVEVSGAPLYEDVPSIHEIFAHLHERSFEVTGLFPVARDPADGVQVVDFDAMFVRRPLIRRPAADVDVERR